MKAEFYLNSIQKFIIGVYQFQLSEIKLNDNSFLILPLEVKENGMGLVILNSHVVSVVVLLYTLYNAILHLLKINDILLMLLITFCRFLDYFCY